MCRTCVCVGVRSHGGGGGGFTVWIRVCVCVSVHHSHHVQPCSCVSRVDVPKWGHFLSVWCLRNNPTAQKLLQPSASTYSSLYSYWSGSASSVCFSSYSRSFGCAWLDPTTAAVWCLLCCSQYEVLVSFPNFQCTSLTSNCWKSTSHCEISDLGSNVCDLICLIWFVFTSLHARFHACFTCVGAIQSEID